MIFVKMPSSSLDRKIMKQQSPLSYYPKRIIDLTEKTVLGLLATWYVVSKCSLEGKIPWETNFIEIKVPIDFPPINWVKLVKIPTPSSISSITPSDNSDILGRLRFPISPASIEWWIYRQPNFYNPDNNTFSVYYQTNQVWLDKYDTNDIKSYLRSLQDKKVPFPKSMIVSSYADVRWTPELNQKLSDERNSGITEYLKDYFRVNWLEVEIKTASFGNAKATIYQSNWDPEVTYAKDRRVEIYESSTQFIRSFIKDSPADIYLIDGSGSMNTPIDRGNKKTRMNAVQEAQFREWSSIFIFQIGSWKAKIGKASIDIRDKSANLSDGWTPLYEALLLTIQQNPWKTITLISDWQWDTKNLSAEVLKYAKKNNCIINIWAIQIPLDLQWYFKDLARQTWGSYAMIQE